MTGKQTIDAAIVGLGWWGRHIVRSLAGSESIRLRRAVDADPGAAAAFAAEHALPLSADLAELLADESIDAVILATPQALHEAQVIASAAAGKHVFCEKPLALTRAGAERAIAACRAAGVVLGIGHERRFEPALTEIKRLADAGELGTLMHVEANYCHDRLTGLDPSNWRAAGAGQPPAGMTGTGVHMTDAFIHMFGEIGQVCCACVRGEIDAVVVNDFVSAHIVSCSQGLTRGCTSDPFCGCNPRFNYARKFSSLLIWTTFRALLFLN